MTASGTNTAQLFRAHLNMIRYTAGSSEQLIYCPDTGKAHMLPIQEGQILGNCNSFATLDQHAARICKEMGLGQWQWLRTRKMLAELAETGLLVSHESLTRRLTSEKVVDEPVQSISSLGIPTCNRPESLARSLRSYAECSNLYGRQIRFVVSDQSEDTGTQKANVETIARLQKELRIAVEYAGLDERKEFAKSLSVHSSIDPTIVSFALLNDENCPIATGANRNALLLGSVGELTMQVDDDTICRLSPGPELTNGLALVTKFEVNEFWFLNEKESEEVGSGCKAENLFALHEQLLGKSLSHCISEVGEGELDLTEASHRSFFHAQRREGRVLVTAIGSAGDSGIGTPYYYLHLHGQQRARLLRTETDYRHFLFRDTVIKSVRRATISDEAFCPGVNIGLDTRQLLPPFMPVQRSQDCIFSMLLYSCVLGYTGYLPWVLLHKRPSQSAYTEVQLQMKVAGHRSVDIIRLILKRFAPQPSFDSAEKNMLVLGRTLKEWGSIPLADFEEMVRLEILKDLCGQQMMMEHHLKMYNAQPPYWANDITSCLSKLRETLTDEHLVVASDLQAVFGREQARILTQRLVYRFGQLIESWPALFEAARNLRALGVPLGRKV